MVLSEHFLFCFRNPFSPFVCLHSRKLINNQSIFQILDRLISILCQHKCDDMRIEGRTGGVSGTVHGPKKQRITNHGYQNFTFPNHENQHVKHFYLVSV